METSGAHKCIKCQRFVHIVFCGEAVEEGFGGSAICTLCKDNQKKFEGVVKNINKPFQPIARSKTRRLAEQQDIDNNTTDRVSTV